MAGAKAGNSLDNATKINVFNRSRTFRGSVSASRPSDFYTFEVDRIARRNSYGITVRNIDDDVELTLLNSRGKVLRRSSNPDDASEVLSSTNLAPGQYYIRVSRISGATSYRMTVAVFPSSDPADRIPRRRPREVFDPSDLETARKVNIVGGTRKFEGSVSQGNEDFYRFDLSRPSSFSLFIRDLDENVDVDLINVQGELIRRSANQGDASEVIAPLRSLAAGVYYVRVYGRGGRTNYDLFMSAIVDDNRNPPPSTDTPPSLIRNINTGTANSDPADPVLLNNILYFAATDATGGRELWRSDGTIGGTQRVLDINPGRADSNPTDLAVVNGIVYFAADDGVNGRELWRSDGTANGTQRVASINPGAGDSNPTDLVEFNGLLYFAANDGVNGKELWRSDGTDNGTQRLGNINPGASSSNPTDLVVVGDTLYFAADDGIRGRELWSFNGTDVALVDDVNIGPGDSDPIDLVGFNGTLFFSADNGINGRELFQLTASGSSLVRDVQAGAASSNPTELVVSGDRLFFAADDGIRGNELWSTDGTSAGTNLVRDIRVGEASSDPRDLIDVGGVLYLTADNSTNGRQIFRSNGTLTGTVILTTFTELNPNELIAIPTEGGNALFFAGTVDTTGTELYRIPI